MDSPSGARLSGWKGGIAGVRGSGPDGRVEHDDLDRLLLRARGPLPAMPEGPAEEVVPLRGVRRRIAERMSQAWAQIPHITYVEAVDVTELEALRHELIRREPGNRLTVLPFVARAVVKACAEQPGLNAHLTEDPPALRLFPAVHLGVATQTDNGLIVPVVRHAERLDVRELADEITRVAQAARSGTAAREELTGSTITITSLGAIGGLVTTPIINQPEVAIVGVTDDLQRDAAVSAAETAGVSYPLRYDEDAALMTDLGITGLPATVFVDEDGTVLGRHLGALTEADLLAEIEDRYGIAP